MPEPAPPSAASPGEAAAFLGDRFLPWREARLPLDDGLIAGGVAVTERLRTFGGVPFAVGRHLDRLRASAAAAFVPLPPTFDALPDRLAAVVAHNCALLEPGAELSVGVFVTAGSPGGGPVAGVTATELNVTWADELRDGARLVVPATRQIPAECLDPRIKTRSRLHWHVAARQAADIDPAARPLLLHPDETVAETDTGNVLAVRGRALLSPPVAGTLDGITRAVTRDLAAALGYGFEERPLTVDELLESDEVLLTSTTPVLLPAASIDGRQVGPGAPGPAFAELLAAWERHVGVPLRGAGRASDRS